MDAPAIESSIREKVLPDARSRYNMRDARLALARVCALQGSLEEAQRWFDEARVVLDREGARPLRAVVDYDQGLALYRSGSSAQSRLLVIRALDQFRTLGMPGWIRRAEETLASIDGARRR